MLNRLKPKSEFSKNVLTLMTGTTIAQAIPIALSPILTRIYTPEDFGILALYIAIVSFVAIVITARYEMAIVLPKSDEDAINIVALSLVIMLSTVLLLFITIALFKNKLLILLNAESVGNLLYLIPLSVLAAGINQIFNYWSNRKSYFKNMSSAQISQSVSIGILQPVFGYFHLFGGLIIGNLTGRIVGAFILIDKFLKNDKQLIYDINKQMMLTQMKKYKDFPLVNSLHAFSDIIRSSGSVMLLSSFFGATVLGFYALSLRVLQVPVGIIGSALGQVLYTKFTQIHNDEKPLYAYVKNIFMKLFIISILLFSILYFIIPDLFAFVFGDTWKTAGEYSRLLIPYLAINFLITPLSSLPIILKMQKEAFLFSVVGNLLYLSTIVFFNQYGAESVFSIISLFMVIYFLCVIYFFRKALMKEIIR
ncbi:lipopolysaccharide biosynthesis protein [Sulfurimonas sp.]